MLMCSKLMLLLLNYTFVSAQSSDDGEDDKSNRRFHFDEAERLNDHRSCVSRQTSVSYSELYTAQTRDTGMTVM